MNRYQHATIQGSDEQKEKKNWSSLKAIVCDYHIIFKLFLTHNASSKASGAGTASLMVLWKQKRKKKSKKWCKKLLRLYIASSLPWIERELHCIYKKHADRIKQQSRLLEITRIISLIVILFPNDPQVQIVYNKKSWKGRVSRSSVHCLAHGYLIIFSPDKESGFGWFCR